MDNQQERPAVDKNFVAGLIAGEGWFGICKTNTGPDQKTKYGFTLRPAFKLQMNDVETMELVRGAFEGWGLAYYVSHPKGAYCIDVNGLKRMDRFLSLILPYLTGKKLEAASIVRQFVDLRLSKKAPVPYGEEEVAFANAIKAVNGNNGYKDNKKPHILLVSSETTRPAPLTRG